jgi:hypothetical protein
MKRLIVLALLLVAGTVGGEDDFSPCKINIYYNSILGKYKAEYQTGFINIYGDWRWNPWMSFCSEYFEGDFGSCKEIYFDSLQAVKDVIAEQKRGWKHEMEQKRYQHQIEEAWKVIEPKETR